MLTYDALIKEAKNSGMPTTKMRGILREYLQILILKELYRSENGRKLYFTGGTYLRIVHNLKRFSEDLDFNTDNINKKEFENIINNIAIELKRKNIDSKIMFNHCGNIYAADMCFYSIEKAYNITSIYSKKSGIVIKMETNRPKWKIKKETSVISGFGETYPCICTDKGALFADKIDAFNKKERARHLYDIIFMLSNKYSIDKNVLLSLGIRTDPFDVILKRTMSFSKSELKKQAERLKPFLFEESDSDLIANAHDIIPALIDKYKRLINQS